MTYHVPETVTSPRNHWRFQKLLWNSGDGGASLALGTWNGAPCLAMRWNGSSEGDGLGNPQSRGLPTWFIVPSDFNEAVLAMPELDLNEVERARALFALHSDTEPAFR